MTRPIRPWPLNVSNLWDIDAHRRAGGRTPWSFFGYPKALADEQRLPRDEEALRYLVAIQQAGVRVGIYESRHTPGEITVACPFEEYLLLDAAIKDLERQGAFPKDFVTSISIRSSKPSRIRCLTIPMSRPRKLGRRVLSRSTVGARLVRF
jgi:hypothetical protein